MSSWSQAPTLAGYGFQIEPLRLDHAEGLHAVCPPDNFQYYVTLQPRGRTLEDFTDYLNTRLQASATQSMVIVNEAGKPIGESAFMDMREGWRCLEIGMTWFAPEFRGTRANPATKLLMLAHAFDTLGCLRVTLKTDSRNLHSQAAILKLGAKLEGTLRSFGIQPNGYVRDTTYFSILEDEWPSVRAKLLQRLS